MAGLDSIPALVLYANDREAAAIAISENLQRQNLSYIEESEGIRILKNGFKYTDEEISHIINKDISYINDVSQLIDVSSVIKKYFIENNITKNQALAVLKIEDDTMKRVVIKKIAEYNLSDEAAEELVENTIRQQKIKNSTELSHFKEKSRLKDIRLFNNSIKQALSIIKDAGMETSYVVSKKDDDYEIIIKISG